ncbi:hypothetical protein [Glutamicibacter sp. AOP5-A2-18]|uniref:hypothetical protein n=1 Tax=Glutamicibacter sp. AOP5-A2-18 TaxID=3457656 RepID=UPI0040333E15
MARIKVSMAITPFTTLGELRYFMKAIDHIDGAEEIASYDSNADLNGISVLVDVRDLKTSKE